jgi:hypothetical protein
MNHFTDEPVCWAYMEEMRWRGNVFCPFFNAPKPYKLKNNKTYRCSSKTCRKYFTVSVGTVFENSKNKLSTWLAALYLLIGHKKGISNRQFARDLGITQKSGWFVPHMLRLILGEPEPEPLKKIVEVDETYVGGKFENMNRGRRKLWQESGKDTRLL